MKKIVIGSDHAGFDLKEHLKTVLATKGFDVDDAGCYSKESVDYPLYGKSVAQKVSEGDCERGVLICSSGIGMSIVANRFHNVRAALCRDEDSAEMSRAHNDSNILVLGSKYVSYDQAVRILEIWLTRDFDGGRHQRRVSEIDNKVC